MHIIDPPAVLACAALLNALSQLVWSIRRDAACRSPESQLPRDPRCEQKRAAPAEDRQDQALGDHVHARHRLGGAAMLAQYRQERVESVIRHARSVSRSHVR